MTKGSLLVYLLGLTKGGHTWAHHEALPVFCQWSGFDQVSGWMVISHHAHKISEGTKKD